MCQTCLLWVCLVLLHPQLASLGHWCGCSIDVLSSGKVTLGLQGLSVCFHVQLSSPHYVLGTPETSRRGRSTRKARRALTSNPPGLPPCPCIDGCSISTSAPSDFSSLVKSSKTTLKSLSENKERTSRLSLSGKTHCATCELRCCMFQY